MPLLLYICSKIESMLSIQLFRQEKELVLAGLQKKNFSNTALVDSIIEVDELRRTAQQENDALAAIVNAASKEIGALMGKGEKEAAEALKQQVAQHKDQAKALQTKLSELDARLQELLISLPNLPHQSVPTGKTPEENEIVKQAGVIPDLSAQKAPHWELTEKYKLIDFELGNKITGSGFPVYIDKGAKLQRALISYFLDYNTSKGYKEYYPPHMVNADSAYATGQLPDKEGQMYHMPEDNFYMIPTAEVPLTNIFRDVILTEQELPIKITGYTPCFRREAGSYGKDVRGLNRLHQFDKVEIVQLVPTAQSYQVLEEMVAHVEGLLQALELPYRILRLCGGDMSFASALTYDFEVYSAAQERWLEVSSVSNFENFQTNRLKARYKDAQGKIQALHSLNGSSLALPRILACLLENKQTPNGIELPSELIPYLGANFKIQ
jgi:seryl-tRNA synthetase